MPEEEKSKEVIEIITHPKDGRMELAKMIAAMSAINRDYRRWLKEENKKPEDADLALYVEKVERGSIKLWLAKFKEVGIPLIKYGADFLQKIESPQKDAAKWPQSELQNKRAFLKSNMDNKLEANLLKVDESGKITIINQGNFQGQIIITSDKIKSNEDLIAGLLAKEKKLHKDTPISFTKYDVKKNARIIAHRIDSENDYTALLSKSARVFLNKERQNIFNKQYAANVVVSRISGSNEIHSYVVKKITAS